MPFGSCCSRTSAPPCGFDRPLKGSPGRTGAIEPARLCGVIVKVVQGQIVSRLCRNTSQISLRSSSCCRTNILPLDSSRAFLAVGRHPSRFLDRSLTVSPVDRRLGIRFRHLILHVATASVLVAAIFVLLNSGRSDSLSKATAYVGLFYLAVTLVIGPLNVLRGAANPLSTYLRRDFGIIAGVLSLLHTFVGLQVHMSGDFIQYFF